jgi:hypothetical protein
MIESFSSKINSKLIYRGRFEDLQKTLEEIFENIEIIYKKRYEP